MTAITILAWFGCGLFSALWFREWAHRHYGWQHSWKMADVTMVVFLPLGGPVSAVVVMLFFALIYCLEAANG